MKKHSILWLATLILAVMFSGCQNKTEESTGPNGEQTTQTAQAARTPKAGDKFVIGMSQCNLGEPWRVQMDQDVRSAAQNYPEIKVIFKDAQNDSLKQASQIREFINQGVDALIVSPKEAVPLTPPVAEAFQKGIPVIVLDRAVTGDQFTCFIGADNKRIGKAVGKWLASKYPAGTKVVELKGLMTSPPGQDRNSGFREGIKDANFDVIFDVDMQWDESTARNEMESALSRFDKIDVVYAHNDPGAHGAYMAAKNAGREKDMIFVGIDGLPQEGQKYVKEGILAASFEYPTGGKDAIDMVLKALKGEQIPKQIVLPSRVFTPENIDQGGEPIPE